MNLFELNEKYEDYMDTKDFYLEEGLKFFKISKKLFKYSDHLENKMKKIKMKKDYGDLNITSSDIKRIKSHLNKAKKLAKDLQSVERDFRFKEINRKEAKEKIKEVKESNKEFFKELKSDSMVGILKQVGGSAIVTGIIVLLAGGFTPLMLFSPGVKTFNYVKDYF